MSRAGPFRTQCFSDEQVAALNRRLTGEVVAAQHPAYDRARRIWNYMIDRRPVLEFYGRR